MVGDPAAHEDLVVTGDDGPPTTIDDTHANGVVSAWVEEGQDAYHAIIKVKNDKNFWVAVEAIHQVGGLVVRPAELTDDLGAAYALAAVIPPGGEAAYGVTAVPEAGGGSQVIRLHFDGQSIGGGAAAALNVLELVALAVGHGKISIAGKKTQQGAEALIAASKVITDLPDWKTVIDSTDGAPSFGDIPAYASVLLGTAAGRAAIIEALKELGVAVTDDQLGKLDLAKDLAQAGLLVVDLVASGFLGTNEGFVRLSVSPLDGMRGQGLDVEPEAEPAPSASLEPVPLSEAMVAEFTYHDWALSLFPLRMVPASSIDRDSCGPPEGFRRVHVVINATPGHGQALEKGDRHDLRGWVMTREGYRYPEYSGNDPRFAPQDIATSGCLAGQSGRLILPGATIPWVAAFDIPDTVEPTETTLWDENGFELTLPLVLDDDFDFGRLNRTPPARSALDEPVALPNDTVVSIGQPTLELLCYVDWDGYEYPEWDLRVPLTVDNRGGYSELFATTFDTFGLHKWDLYGADSSIIGLWPVETSVESVPPGQERSGYVVLNLPSTAVTCDPTYYLPSQPWTLVHSRGSSGRATTGWLAVDIGSPEVQVTTTRE
jgi:hypothetical protein